MSWSDKNKGVECPGGGGECPTYRAYFWFVKAIRWLRAGTINKSLVETIYVQPLGFLQNVSIRFVLYRVINILINSEVHAAGLVSVSITLLMTLTLTTALWPYGTDHLSSFHQFLAFQGYSFLTWGQAWDRRTDRIEWPYWIERTAEEL